MSDESIQDLDQSSLSTVYSGNSVLENNNSYLSEDLSPLPKKHSKKLSSLNETEENSFIINDSELIADSTFLSTDNSIQLDESLPAARKQPSRFAKMDLNTPLRAEPCMTSTPANVREPRKELTTSVRRKMTVLEKKVEDPEMRAMFLELYPELAEQYAEEEEPSPPDFDLSNVEPTNQEDSVICISSDSEEEKQMEVNEEESVICISDSEDEAIKSSRFIDDETEETDGKEEKESCDEDTEEDVSSCEEREESEEESEKEVRHSPNKNSTIGSNDSFERYLKVLKGDNKKEEAIDNSESEAEEEGPFIDDDDFIVSDTESITESDEDEEELDSSEDECSSDESNQENIPKGKLHNQVSKNTPKKQKFKNDDDYFLASLSMNFDGKRHSEAVKYVEKGIKNKKIRENLTTTLFEIFKRRCFDAEIKMEREHIHWTGRLRTTAGQCRNDIKNSTSTIQLSIKVCSTPERLRDTLIHEMCHAATWLIDWQMKARHGPFWRRWTHRCRDRCPSLPPIEVCHAYKIEKKFIYECEGCGQKIGRDTKSFDTERKICGICKGQFVLVNDKPDSEKKTNKFAAFVKLHYAVYKKGGMKHQEVMAVLSQKWKEESEKAKEELNIDLSVLTIRN